MVSPQQQGYIKYPLFLTLLKSSTLSCSISIWQPHPSVYRITADTCNVKNALQHEKERLSASTTPKAKRLSHHDTVVQLLIVQVAVLHASGLTQVMKQLRRFGQVIRFCAEWKKNCWFVTNIFILNCVYSVCTCVFLHLSALYQHQPAERRRCDSFSLQGSVWPHGSRTKNKLRFSATFLCDILYIPQQGHLVAICPSQVNKGYLSYLFKQI